MTKQELVELQNKADRADKAERYLAVINSPEARGKIQKAKTMLEDSAFDNHSAEAIIKTLAMCEPDAATSTANTKSRDEQVLASPEAHGRQRRAKDILSENAFASFSVAQICLLYTSPSPRDRG